MTEAQAIQAVEYAFGKKAQSGRWRAYLLQAALGGAVLVSLVAIGLITSRFASRRFRTLASTTPSTETTGMTIDDRDRLGVSGLAELCHAEGDDLLHGSDLRTHDRGARSVLLPRT